MLESTSSKSSTTSPSLAASHRRMEHLAKLREHVPQKDELQLSLSLELVAISDVDETYEGHGQLRFQICVNHPDIEEEFGYDELKHYQLHHEIPFLPNNSFLSNAKECQWDHDECEFEIHDGVLSGLIEFHAVVEDSMDLHYFPFDRQSMNISIKFNQFEREKDLKVVFYDEKVKVHMASGVLLNEWCIEPVIEHYGLERHPKYGGPTSLEVRFRIERIPIFYISQVVRPLFLIVCLGSVSCTMEVSESADRLSVILTLLLTAVAFKYMVAEYLPRVPYTTYLDHYVTSSFTILFLSAIEIGAAKLLVNIGFNKEIIASFDLWFWILVYLPYAVAHIAWFVTGCTDKPFRPSWEDVERNDDFLENAMHNAVSRIVSTSNYEAIGDYAHICAAAKAASGQTEDKKHV